MIIVIETEDFEDEEALKTHLRHMQEDSDELAADSLEDYWPGYGPLSLGTSRVALAAKVVGVGYDAGQLTGTTRLLVIESTKEGE
jgi:hypothetical protein